MLMITARGGGSHIHFYIYIQASQAVLLPTVCSFPLEKSTMGAEGRYNCNNGIGRARSLPVEEEPPCIPAALI